MDVTHGNHRAFVAFAVHLECDGMPLSLPLDIIEVAKVSGDSPGYTTMTEYMR